LGEECLLLTGAGRQGNGKREGRGMEEGKWRGGKEGEGRLASYTILGPDKGSMWDCER